MMDSEVGSEAVSEAVDGPVQGGGGASVLAMGAQRCPALRKDGQPCRATPGASGYCVGHDPASAAARAKGGRSTGRAARALRLLPERLRPVADMLARALEEVHSGALEPRRASAMAAVAGALVRVTQAGEMEERVRALEAQAARAERMEESGGKGVEA